MSSVLILGAGYVGETFAQKSRAVRIYRTHRRIQNTGQRFELEDPTSWSELPSVDATLWSFPARPLSLVKDFCKAYRKFLGKLVVIGSSASYRVREMDAWVDETSELDTSERTQGEEWLREQSAVVVRAAGIYGPDRNPVEWLRSGRVAASEKFVNFIHVEDLGSLLQAAFEKAKPGSCYIASDGRPYRWSELAEFWQKEYGLSLPYGAKPSRRSSKQLSSRRAIEELDWQPRYRDVLEGVRLL